MRNIILISILVAISFLLGNIYATYGYNKSIHDSQLYQARTTLLFLELIKKNETDTLIKVLESDIETQLGMYAHVKYESQRSMISHWNNYLKPTFYIQVGLPKEDEKEISSNVAQYILNNPLKMETPFDCNDLATLNGRKRCDIFRYWENIHVDLQKFIDENKI